MHPSLIFLLSLLGVCTATFFGGGESTKSLPVISFAQPSHPHVIEHDHIEHNHVQPSPKIIKVILQSADSHDHTHEHGHDHSPQIIKVIHENGHGDYGEHGHHDSHSSKSKFLSILPQILEIVLADEGRSHSHDHGHGYDHGHGHDHGHGYDHGHGHDHGHGYDHGHGHDHGHGNDHGHNHGGSFFSTESKGADFYKGGHVIESGELKLTKIPNNKNYDDDGFDKGSLLSSLFAQKPSGSSGWSSASSGWSSSGPSDWSSGWN